ncbi:MAG: leucine--tRNA ligase [Candidatus Bathyarchaeia archaeon]
MKRTDKPDWGLIQTKWRALWDQHRIFEADPKKGAKKYFLTVAYPYPNSPQHIGHGRTYTLTDVYARFLRMRGYNVLFPMAFHYTGTPVLAMAKRLREKDPELIDAFTRIYRVPEEKIPSLNTPVNIARYFHQEIKEGMRALGYSIDWRREFTTIDPAYSKFIEWQFHVLREKGLITKGSHPVGWCPRCGNPVGQHDTMGDVEPQIEEFILLKFTLDNKVMPTATLRPETVFGVTNLWINPSARYVRAKIDGEEWVVSEKAAEKLTLLGRRVEVEAGDLGASFIGKKAINPATGKEVLILPAAFVDPSHASGVVMSVPAHAPYDYQALEDLKADRREIIKHSLDPAEIQSIRPIPLIRVEGYGDVPAKDAIEKWGIGSQTDPRLENATEEVYSKEFHTGVMTEAAGKYAGASVAEAKRRVAEDYFKAGKADRMYEILNRPVICRCGTECVVKVFENQWFINYGDQNWKTLALACLDRMTIIPEEIRPEFVYTVGWLREKACARREGLGTPLPWDPSWIIESLSDSVIYMAYYTIAHIISSHRIPEDQLTIEVFDYLFLGKGDLPTVSARSGIKPETLASMREEFSYFYPLDSRHSGRDLVPNHLTFFIFNHVAIFPKELWPRQIVVNGSVLMEGKKMSKSFGNIIPIREGVERYSADGLRLSILSTSGLLQDADFSPTLAQSIKDRLERLYRQSSEIADKPVEEEDTHGLAERWIISRLQSTIKAATESLESLQVREAVQHIFYNLDQDIQWYMKFTASTRSREAPPTSRRVLREVFKTRLKLLAPFTPFICEELWERLGEKGFISAAPWPNYNPSLTDLEAEESIDLIKTLIQDTASILEATSIRPTRILYYTAAEWKSKIYRQALELARERRLEQSELMKTAMQEPKVRQQGKAAVKFIAEAASTVSKMPPDAIQRRLTAALDEHDVLKIGVPFIKEEFKAEVEVYREDDPGKPDPKNRAHLATPRRPAIYIE